MGGVDAPAGVSSDGDRDTPGHQDEEEDLASIVRNNEQMLIDVSSSFFQSCTWFVSSLEPYSQDS